MAISVSVRQFTLTTTSGAELGTFTNLAELGDAFVAHFGKGYKNLAGTLVDALSKGKDTSTMERILGIHVTSEYVELAA